LNAKCNHLDATRSIDLSAQSSILLNRMQETSTKMGDVSMQIESYRLMEKGVNGSGDLMVPSTINDAELSGQMIELKNKQLEYASMKKNYGENHPSLVQKMEEINKLRPSINESIRTKMGALVAQKNVLSAQTGGINSVLSSVPKNERAILEINRQYSTKKGLFENLIERRQEIELSMLSDNRKSKIVDKPVVSDRPVSPKKMVIYALAIFAALGICIGIISVKDALTAKIKYRLEIEKMTSVPVIGEIAFDKSNNPLVIEKGTRSFVAEEFRKLRISLSFLGVDSSHRKLLVTSSISGEGKSFVAANLAVSVSLTGKRVIIVDLDLNNPSQAKILGADYEHGVTELLTGEKKIEQVIHKLDGHDSLYYISAGVLPENPTELLANGKINSIIDYLDLNFDLVVIDTSPAVLVTDAFILSSLCNATLYVVRHDYTPKILVKRLDENNAINPLHNPAIVFNGVKSRGLIRNNYGYGYDYVYGNKDRGAKNKKVS
jgi:tyrosine-protein kinase Etk/Wzc